MNFAFLATLALLLCSTACAVAPVKLSGEQLRAAIAGVWWFSEEPMMRHIAERMQYFPDGRFIGDYRIRTPSSEHYIRKTRMYASRDSRGDRFIFEVFEPGKKIPVADSPSCERVMGKCRMAGAGGELATNDRSPNHQRTQ